MIRKFGAIFILFFLLFSVTAMAVVDEDLEEVGDDEFQITQVDAEAELEDMDEEELEDFLSYVEEELGSPGITPDSPMYFANRFLDVFKSNERVANERAAAVAFMADRGDEKALARALESYERALERRSGDSDRGEDDAESVAEQTSKHLEVLARVQERVPEYARGSVGNALERSAEGRERSIERLSEMNPERGQQVAERTMQRVMKNAPEEAQKGLQRAFENVQNRMGRTPDEMAGGMPEDVGRRPDEAGQAPDDIGDLPDDAGDIADEVNQLPDEAGQAPDEAGELPDDAEDIADEVDQLPDDLNNTAGEAPEEITA